MVNNVNFITWSTCDQVKAKFCFNSSGMGGRDFIARPGSHVIMFSVGSFTIRLLFCVNKWCFLKLILQ